MAARNSSLSAEAFRVLKTGSRASARAQFRSLLGQYFAIEEIGDRLIARERSQITPAQYQAYQAALPGFLIGTYADRLYDYADAKVTVSRVVPRGNGAAVMSQVTRPGQSPVTAIWTGLHLRQKRTTTALLATTVTLLSLRPV